MHSAPSVTYPVGRSRFAAALLIVIWLLAGAAVALWLALSPSVRWVAAAAVLSWMVTGAWAAACWWRSPVGVVGWDGKNWNWSGEPGAGVGAPEVSLDLQRTMLVRCTGSRASHWFWVERASRAERWDDLRRAVYSRAPLGTLPDSGAPEPNP